MARETFVINHTGDLCISILLVLPQSSQAKLYNKKARTVIYLAQGIANTLHE